MFQLQLSRGTCHVCAAEVALVRNFDFEEKADAENAEYQCVKGTMDIGMISRPTKRWQGKPRDVPPDLTHVPIGV